MKVSPGHRPASCRPGNRVQLLQDGPRTYEAVFAAIKAARDHINMETYILTDDDIGRPFADLLSERQRQGVQVNLIRDGVGTLSTLRLKDMFARCGSTGSDAECRFRPARFGTVSKGGIAMKSPGMHGVARLCAVLAALSMATVLALLGVASAHAQDAAALRAKHEALRAQLADNAFKRPLVLESTQDSGALKGEVYAVVDHPFSVVVRSLRNMHQWCDPLILHLNVKNCSSAGEPPNQVLSLVVGRKFDQPIDDGHRVDFNYSVPTASADYLRVQMAAEDGPVGTRDYRLALDAVPLNAGSTFLHMSYAYAYGTAARVGMQMYLATAGRDKVGFSVVGKTADGKPIYVDGVRGVVERNTMRYYLAIEIYLDSLAAPAGQQTDQRLVAWFAATERHARQLHEISRDEYLAMKHSEVQRQRAGAAAR